MCNGRHCGHERGIGWQIIGSINGTHVGGILPVQRRAGRFVLVIVGRWLNMMVARCLILHVAKLAICNLA